MDVHTSTPKPGAKLQQKHQKIKAAIRAMVRFLDRHPTPVPTMEEANLVIDRTKRAPLSEALLVKTQGKHEFNVTTPLCLTIIRQNESLLTDKSKPFHRPLPIDTPPTFIEHVHHHKIHNV